MENESLTEDLVDSSNRIPAELSPESEETVYNRKNVGNEEKTQRHKATPQIMEIHSRLRELNFTLITFAFATPYTRSIAKVPLQGWER